MAMPLAMAAIFFITGMLDQYTESAGSAQSPESARL